MSEKSVFCIATSYPQAERIVENLQSAGFAPAEISVLLPATDGAHDIGHVKATKAPEGATAGATTGGVAGPRDRGETLRRETQSGKLFHLRPRP